MKWDVSLALFNELPFLHRQVIWALASEEPTAAFVWAHLAMATLVVLPGTLFMGATFPFVLRLFRQAALITTAPARAGDQVKADVGNAYALNTVGGIAGSLAAGFLIVPAIGFYPAIQLTCALTMVVGCIWCLLEPSLHVARRSLAVVAMLAPALVVWERS